MQPPTKEEQILNYRDEQDRKQFSDYKLGTRRSPLSNNVLMLLGDILQPQTQGYDHVNLDMSFSYQDHFGVGIVKNSSFLVTWFHVYGFKKALFLERSTLATHLVVSRSLDGKSMDLFIKSVGEQRQVFEDVSQKKTGFGAIFSKKNKER